MLIIETVPNNDSSENFHKPAKLLIETPTKLGAQKGLPVLAKTSFFFFLKS